MSGSEPPLSPGSAPVDLPAPTPQAEDTWVLGLRERGDTDLVALIKACMHAKRPSLAGRVVGLLAAASKDPDVIRARQAARLLCLQAPAHWEAQLDELLERIRGRHMDRARQRARAKLNNPGRLGQAPSKRSRGRRRPRLSGVSSFEGGPPESLGDSPAEMTEAPFDIRRSAGLLLSPFVRAWGRLDQRHKVHAYAMGLLAVVALANFLVYTFYYVEDAGISMAYARNAAAGEGWVTYAGGERVEGFSNPLWTFLMGLGYLVGVNGFVSSKLMGAVFGLACLPLSYALAQEARPQSRDHFPLLAPLFVSVSTTVAIWHGSGLENSLFSVLLLSGMWRVLKEARTLEQGQPALFPLSALAFLGLAATRPEGIAYGAVGGFFMLVLTLRSAQGKTWVRQVGLWLAVFFVPYLLFQAWRYSYFAWPFPNTYYAKVDGENRFQPWRWTTRGWDYLRNYLRAYHIAMFAPILALGLVGLKDWRKWALALGTVVLAVFLIWNGREGLPADFDPDWMAYLQRHWDRARIIAVLSCAGLALLLASKPELQTRLGVALIGLGSILLGLFGLPETSPESLSDGMVYGGAGVLVLSLMVHTSRQGAARGLTGAVVGVGCFFVLYSGGDWMAQWRFVSYIIIPLLVLMAVGFAELLSALPGGRYAWARWLWGTPLFLLLAAPNIWQAMHAGGKPVTSVNDVHQRVIYMQSVQDRLHIERVVLFDVDMGAHMYFSDWRIVDVAGLVDVPMGHHIFQKPFITEYVFEEQVPTFAHQHAGWARKTKVASLPIWGNNYIEVPGYPTGRSALHIGNHIRRDIILRPEYEGPRGRKVALEGQLEFEGWHLVSPEVPQGGKLFLEYWLKAGFREQDVRVFAVLDDGQGHRHLASVPAAYGYVHVKDWKASEHARTRVDFDLPESLPEGQYNLGFLILDAKTGEALAPLGSLPPGAGPGMIEGSFQWGGVVQIVSRERATQEAVADYAQALDLAEQGQCEPAFQAWRRARYHVWKNTAWRDQRQEEIDAALARCWVGAARSAATQRDAVAALYEARWYDHREPLVDDFALPYAQLLVAQGRAAQAEGDVQGAYESFRDALICDPSLSHIRREAEGLRDQRLGISAKDKRYRPPKVPVDLEGPGAQEPEQGGEPASPEGAPAQELQTLTFEPGAKQPHELKPSRVSEPEQEPAAKEE